MVFRWVGSDLRLLLLHRKHNGSAYEGDWAWTTPSGARLPGELVHACAQRELAEETGLTLPLYQDSRLRAPAFRHGGESRVARRRQLSRRLLFAYPMGYE